MKQKEKKAKRKSQNLSKQKIEFMRWLLEG